ncbi:2'-5' RNA ligase family protein [Bacillus ginsengihumi]|uniref:2'-5' RNA ligase family protein n=1 Tax=Heyndrickxia ginsengihumi TaxID=363870 RepID=A0A6M0PC22_9BACI|nr:2'-5' RNA ligase family protein [Heyndrickxia ginsengihumi]NEY21600.1 2'-5' RNA ligase family protein [Heyndrickxia ginsengihumi]
MEHFTHDTYIVLDVPQEISDKVMSIRSRFKDQFYMALPAEVTVAGSSGVGVLKSSQNSSNVYSRLDEIAAKTKAIKASFGEVQRFPYTNIFFFSLQNENPFRKLHEEIVQSNIRFLENSFPYKPHCTLCNRSSITEEEVDALYSIEVKEEFTFKTMSVYALESTGDHVIVHLLHRATLSGNE